MSPPIPKTADKPAPSSNGFEHLADVVDTDGPIAILTVNVKAGQASAGRVSFQLQREFVEKGAPRRTNFFKRSHIPGLRRLLDDLEHRLDEEEDRARAKLRG